MSFEGALGRVGEIGRFDIADTDPSIEQCGVDRVPCDVLNGFIGQGAELRHTDPDEINVHDLCLQSNAAPNRAPCLDYCRQSSMVSRSSFRIIAGHCMFFEALPPLPKIFLPMSMV